LRTSNPSFVAGVASYNLTLTNTSSQTIFTPLRVEISAISANATAANADNGQTGVGAYWSYSNLVGSDSALSSGETTGARNLRFNDSGGPFSVTFNVVGNLARGTAGPTGGSSGSASSAGSSGGSSSGGSSPATGTVTGLIFRVTYNPLLNTVTVELLRT
jgi:hypothetical protein